MDFGMMNISGIMNGMKELSSGKDMFSEAIGGGFSEILTKAAEAADVTGEIKVENGEVVVDGEEAEELAP